MKRKLLITLVFTLLIFKGQAQVQAEQYIEGPMVGAVTSGETSVNFILKKGNEANSYYVALENITHSTILQATETKEFCLGDNCTYTAVFNNLTPNEDYRAVLYKNTLEIERSQTDIKVPDNIVTDFSFLTGSGAKLYPSGDARHVREDVYEQMATESVDFMVWLGDNIYLPYNDLTPQAIYDSYLYHKMESVKRKDFMKHFFHFGIWDDHDMGYDNATSDFPEKIFSTKMYKMFWPSSGYEVQDGAGTYGTYTYEDADFFLTDVRTYKTRYIHLGETQLTWLKEELLNSTATFKFIEIGAPVVYPWTAASQETSFFQTGERDELFDFIYENDIAGVIFLSGDKHKSYFGAYNPTCNATYPIYEFMCSAMSSNSSTSTYKSADLFSQIVSTNNYGLIDITGTVGNRVCTMTAKDIDGVVLYTMDINENELHTSSTPDLDPDNFINAQYDFTGNVNDSSGNNYNATLNGSTITTDRWNDNNQAYLFDNYPETISIPNAVLDGKSDFSISFWIKPTSDNSNGLLSGSSSTIGNEILIFLGSTNKISFNIKNTSISIHSGIDLNVWNHIAVSRNGTTGDALIFVNGEIEARGVLPTGNLEIVSLLLGNDQDGAGGGNLDPNQQYKGIFDDVVFYDETLCQLQIEELYNNDFKKVVAVTDDVICEEGAVAYEVTGATNGEYKWYKTREGNSLMSNTNAVLNTTITEGTTYWVAADNHWRDSKRTPVTIEVAPVVYDDIEGLTYPSSIFSWYKFDGNATDFTGTNSDGIVTGPILTTDRHGDPNKAYKFTNYEDLITLPSEILDGAEEVTVSFWIKTSESGFGILSAASSLAGNELLIYLNAANGFNIHMNEKRKIFSSPIINDNQWHHVLFSADCKNGQGVLFLDGEKAVTKNSYFGSGELEVPSGAFILGNDQDTPGGGGLSTSQQFVGDLDDLKIYRRALSEEEAIAIYNDSSKYQESFTFNWNSLEICDGENYKINFESTQKNIDYYLIDSSDTVVADGVIDNENVSFSVQINADETFHIIAKNSFNCEKEFDVQFDVVVTSSPCPCEFYKGVITETTFTAGEWSNGLPTKSIKTVFDDDFTITSSFNTCECQVNTGKTLTINADSYLAVENNIVNNGTILVANHASVVQYKNDATVTGSGAYQTTVKTGVLNDPRYVYFSSPTSTDTMNIFSSWGATNRMFEYNETGLSWAFVSTNHTMVPGTGYIVRPTQAAIDNDSPDTNVFTTNYLGAFTNGEVTHTLHYDPATGDNDNILTGNPYPSAMGSAALLSANPEANAFHFWAHTTATDWSSEEYQVWNASGSTTGAPETISTGQGFFVSANAIGDFTFTNDLRLTGDNDTFLRLSNDLDKVWLNLTSDTNVRSQILIAFNPLCTDFFDNQYDAKRFSSDNSISLASNGVGRETLNLAIQTRGELTEETVIPLKILVNDSNVDSLTLSIDHLENLTDWNIYLKDNELNMFHNLRLSNYTFPIESIDEISNRYKLVFARNNALSINDINNKDYLKVAHKDSFFELSSNQSITEVGVYNLLGQLLVAHNENSTIVDIPNNDYPIGSVLFLKVTLSNGVTMTKKVVKL